MATVMQQHTQQRASAASPADWSALPLDCLAVVMDHLFASLHTDPASVRKAWWAVAGVCQGWRAVAVPLILTSTAVTKADGSPTGTPTSQETRAARRRSAVFPSSLHHIFWHPLHALVPQRALDQGPMFTTQRSTTGNMLSRCLVVRTRLSGGRSAFTLYGNAEQTYGRRCFILHAIQTNRLRPTYTLTLSRTQPAAAAFATLRADHLNRTNYTLTTLDASTRPWLQRWLAYAGLLPGVMHTLPAPRSSAYVTPDSSIRGGTLMTAPTATHHPTQQVPANPVHLPAHRPAQPRAAAAAAAMGVRMPVSEGGASVSWGIPEVVGPSSPTSGAHSRHGRGRRKPITVCLARMYPTQFAYGSGLPRRLDCTCLHPQHTHDSGQVLGSALLGLPLQPAVELPPGSHAAGPLSLESTTLAADTGRSESAVGVVTRSVSTLASRLSSLSLVGPNKNRRRHVSSSPERGRSAGPSTARDHARTPHGSPTRAARNAASGDARLGGSGSHVRGSGRRGRSAERTGGVRGAGRRVGSTTGCTTSARRGWLVSVKKAFFSACARPACAALAPAGDRSSQPSPQCATAEATPAAEEHVTALNPTVTVVVRLSGWDEEESRVAIPVGAASTADAAAAGHSDAEVVAAQAGDLDVAASTSAGDVAVLPALDTADTVDSEALSVPEEGEASGSAGMAAEVQAAGSSAVLVQSPSIAEQQHSTGCTDGELSSGAVTGAVCVSTAASAPAALQVQLGTAQRSATVSAPGTDALVPASHSYPALRCVSTPGVVASQDQAPAALARSAPRMVRFNSKQPHWNTNMRCWCLNFGGRVRLPSARNFQLCMPEGPGGDHDPLRVVLQFGKVGQDAFCLDWDLALMSPAQALSCALTTFHRSWGGR